MSNVVKERIEHVLRQGECAVVFTKQNGEERQMVCTLSPDYLPAPSVDGFRQRKVPNDDVVVVWDVQAEGWRSFRIDSIIEGPVLVG